MARLKCAECGTGVSKADVVCRRCGMSLLEDGSVIEVPAAEDAPAEQARPTLRQPAAPPPGDNAEQCPQCGADIPDPRSIVCVVCMAKLSPHPGPRAGGQPRDNGPYATAYEPNDAQLVVTFDFGAIQLTVGQEMLLGREAADTRLAALRSMDNVSRTHATIGLSSDGAWVRDESSTNGTFVNGRRVAAGAVVRLPEGAELRLASNVRATVRLRRPDHG